MNTSSRNKSSSERAGPDYVGDEVSISTAGNCPPSRSNLSVHLGILLSANTRDAIYRFGSATVDGRPFAWGLWTDHPVSA
jgi:hypothetical protein